MKIKQLTAFDNVVVQCHDFPDADSIAAGFGVYTYLAEKGKNVRLIYGGSRLITKPNLLMMIEKLNIPIKHVDDIDTAELIVTVDCFYGEGNVFHFQADKYAAIDHHICTHELTELTEVRENYGSCSTVVMQLLRDDGFDFKAHSDVMTALYYGLYTDTNGFVEIKHPADRDLRDFADYDKTTITLLRNSNLSRDELEVAGNALHNTVYNKEYRFSIAVSQPCDPNILGIINDLVLQTDDIDTSIVCCILPFGIKLSFRSCVTEVHANEIAEFITKGVGSGGGGPQKAGGFIKNALISGVSYDNIARYLEARAIEYFRAFTVIYAEEFEADIPRMTLCQKLPQKVGYVRSTDVIPENTNVCIRTLEADFNIVTSSDIYIMMGRNGYIYPIDKDKFEKTYTPLDEPFAAENIEYQPRIISSSKTYNLLSYVKSCVSSSGNLIYVKKLTRGIKLFTKWDKDNYMLGCPGDYLAVRADDISDCYIINSKVFPTIYRECGENETANGSDTKL